MRKTKPSANEEPAAMGQPYAMRTAERVDYYRNNRIIFSVRGSETKDAYPLAPKLRAADLQEIEANVGEDVLTHLERSISVSTPCYTVLNVTNQPLAAFGVIPDCRDADVGKIWLLGSPELVSYPFLFLRHCKTWVESLQREYKVLWNFVDARNVVHIRWLKWSGFTFLRLIETHGVERRPFYEFEKTRSF